MNKVVTYEIKSDCGRVRIDTDFQISGNIVHFLHDKGFRVKDKLIAAGRPVLSCIMSTVSNRHFEFLVLFNWGVSGCDIEGVIPQFTLDNVNLILAFDEGCFNIPSDMAHLLDDNIHCDCLLYVKEFHLWCDSFVSLSKSLRLSVEG